MCLSTKQNLHNWYTALIGAFILLSRSPGSKHHMTNIWTSIFTLTFTQIQVIESIIWSHVEENNYKKANELARYIVPLLWAQPLMQTVMAYLNTFDSKLLALAGVYLSILIYQTELAFTTDTFDIKITDSKHLAWDRVRDGEVIPVLGGGLLHYIYLFGLLYGLSFIEDRIMMLSLIIFAIISFIISYYYYPDNQFGSVWCYVSVGYIYTAIFANELSIYKS